MFDGRQVGMLFCDLQEEEQRGEEEVVAKAAEIQEAISEGGCRTLLPFLCGPFEQGCA